MTQGARIRSQNCPSPWTKHQKRITSYESFLNLLPKISWNSVILSFREFFRNFATEHLPHEFSRVFPESLLQKFQYVKIDKRHTYQARQSVANARSGGVRITDPIIIQGFQEFLGFPGFLVFPIQINSVEPFDKVFIVDERSIQVGQLLKHFTRGHTFGKMMQ